MGTRSTTKVIEEGQYYVNMYRHMDGYPSGHGRELYEFLKDVRYNGAGCLAAQLVTHFKTDINGIYLLPWDEQIEEYNYTIYVNSDELVVKVTDEERQLFKGKVKSFGTFCKKDKS